MPAVTKTEATQLPSKLSDLFEAALNDFKKIRRSKKFKVDMSTWVTPDDDNICCVCVAGAMMVKTLGSPSDRYGNPCQCPTPTRNRLVAINRLRRGRVSAAFSAVGMEMPKSLIADSDVLRFVSSDGGTHVSFPVSSWNEDDTKPFFNDCRKLIALLRKHGC